MRRLARSFEATSLATAALVLVLPLSLPGQEVNAAVSPAETAPFLRKTTSVLPSGYNLTNLAARRFQLGPLTAGELGGRPTPGPVQIGVRRTFSPGFARQNGAEEILAGGGRVWRIALWSEGALALRIHFRNFGAGGGRVWVYAPPDQDPQGGDILGPYSGTGPYGDGDFWSGSVNSDTAIVEYEGVPGSADEPLPPFEIDAVAHHWQSPSAAALKAQAVSTGSGAPPFATPAACELDVACYASYARVAAGVVMYDFVEGDGAYQCSGAMVNTRNSSFQPYVLSSNHCISSETSARSVEAYFRYQTSACNQTPPDPEGSAVPRVFGAHFLAGAPQSQGDYSFFILSSAAPGGTVFLGWNTAAPEIGESLAVIHHPLGSWKRVSFGARVADSSVADLPANLYYQVLYSSGLTEPGSSGAPLLNASTHIVGTLTGGSTPVCGGSNWDMYGRFSVAYPALKQWLEDAPVCSSSPPSDHWKGEYFNNMTLSGSPSMTRDDGSGMLNFDWGLGTPSAGCGVPVDQFSARWTRPVSFAAGRYRFTATADDGVRVWVDGSLKIDQWKVQAATQYTADVDLTAGTHTLTMEYFESVGNAVARLSWALVTANPCQAAVADGHWKGEYFNNKTLSGSTAMVRDDGTDVLNFDWGVGTPSASCGMLPDQFSVRWTRSVSFGAGRYRFTATADDGVRFYVDGSLKIDEWRVQSPQTFTADVDLTAGNHTLSMEYFENSGGAVAKLSWAPVAGCVATIAADHWKGEYFANMTLDGSPVMVRDDGTEVLNFDWGNGTPSSACGIPQDQFSVRWTRSVSFNAGRYRFTATADDGVRLSVDGDLKIDQWKVQAATPYTAEVDLVAGAHTLSMEYFENTSGAVAKLSWAPVVACVVAVAADHWKGEYFANKTLSGSPAMVRDDGTGVLNFDWGNGTPGAGCGIPQDQFSVRWTRSVSFDAGRYRFTATTDDGVRFYVDGDRKIDQWQDQAAHEYTADVDLTAGAHALVMEYYEAAAGAVAKLSWSCLTCSPIPVISDLSLSGSFTSGSTYSLTGGFNFTDGDGDIKFDGSATDITSWCSQPGSCAWLHLTVPGPISGQTQCSFNVSGGFLNKPGQTSGRIDVNQKWQVGTIIQGIPGFIQVRVSLIDAAGHVSNVLVWQPTPGPQGFVTFACP
jgi:single-stranded DNA-binding protein